MKAPDITESPIGKELVDIMAFGTIGYMSEHGIKPTLEGFEQVVEASRVSGENGQMIFGHPSVRERGLNLIFREGIKVVPLLKELQKMPAEVRTIHQRFRLQHLTPNDATRPEEEKDLELEKLRDQVGEDIYLVLEAFRHGDCQRRLVWARVQEILKTGG